MMQVTKAFYLKTIEFKILLALKGMKEIFGFKLCGEDDIAQAQVNQAIFELNKKGIVFAENNKLILIPEMNELLDAISQADRILIMSDCEGRYPEQCVYIADRAVSLQIAGQNKELVRLERIDSEVLPEWLMEVGGKLEQIITDESFYEEQPAERPGLRHLATELFEKQRELVFEQKKVKVCFEVISLMTRKRMSMIFLYNDEIYDYIVVTNGIQSEVYPYSMKKLHQMLVRCMEGESK